MSWLLQGSYEEQPEIVAYEEDPEIAAYMPS
jgi:hypothetical protein